MVKVRAHDLRASWRRGELGVGGGACDEEGKEDMSD